MGKLREIIHSSLEWNFKSFQGREKLAHKIISLSNGGHLHEGAEIWAKTQIRIYYTLNNDMIALLKSDIQSKATQLPKSCKNVSSAYLEEIEADFLKTCQNSNLKSGYKDRIYVLAILRKIYVESALILLEETSAKLKAS